MATQPPAIATWLLRHLGCSPNNDAVIGDLAERYHKRRSRMWYWRQVLITVISQQWNQITRLGGYMRRATAVIFAVIIGFFLFCFKLRRNSVFTQRPTSLCQVGSRCSTTTKPFGSARLSASHQPTS